jgi:sialate O-acetylesterase
MRMKYQWVLFALFPAFCSADVRLSPCFSSDMVLQRDVPVWLTGWADAGEPVRVKIGGQVVAETAGQGSGSLWTVVLPVFSAGEVPDLTIEGKNSLTLTNLLAGEVWVCSGQSNMEMTLAQGPWCMYGGVWNEAEEVATANHPRLRLYTSGAKTPWQVCSPETAKKFSATAYFFGRELQRKLNVPVGLAVAAVGGTPAEYWTPRAAREKSPGFAEEVLRAKEVLQGDLKKLFDADRKAVEEWRKAVAAAQQKGETSPERPARLLTDAQEEHVRVAIHADSAGSGYDARVRPMTGMAVKGVVWYQGESNCTRANRYADMMKMLVGGWRTDWNQPDLPFVIMQLVNFGGGGATWGSADSWAVLREAQQTIADTVPSVWLATGIDIGDPKNIHPKNKQDAGRRLALVALDRVYRQEIISSGPRPTAVRIDGGTAVLSFDAGGSDQALVLKGGGGFELAGADGAFKPAQAALIGETVVVSFASIDTPCAIRYAWANNPASTLYNTAGLPAAPFLYTVQQFGAGL